MARSPLCNSFELAFALVSIKFARYTVLTSPNKTKQLSTDTALLLSVPLSCWCLAKQSFFLRSISLAIML